METYLVHHGIKGQRWGVRRYQNEDGSWTEAGKRHRGLKLAGAILGGGVAGGLAYAKRSGIRNKAAGMAAARELNKGVKNTKFVSNVRNGQTVAYETEGPSQKQQLAAVSKGLNNVSGNVNSIRSTRRDSAAYAAKQQALEDAKNMTDEQLKERIGRLNLENNYVNAISQQQVVNGADTMDRILAVTGTILGIAATGVGIWSSLKKS